MRPHSAVPPPNPLNAREVRVLRMLASGLEVKQVAHRERVGHEAISNRIARMKRKLGTETTIQTVVVALICGYLRDAPIESAA